jgi:hypothetical protein
VTDPFDRTSAPGRRSPEHWIVLALASAALAVLVAFAVALEPDARGFGTHERLGLPACRTIEWWGVPCPGCGVTTAFTLVAHGRILAALATQPFGALLGIGVPLVALWAWMQHLRGRDLRRETARALRPTLVAALTLAFVGAWLYKLARVRGWLG